MLDLVKPEIEDYARAHSEPLAELFAQLSRETHATMDLPAMLSGPLQGAFLKLLVQVTNAHRILEIGMFAGYSTLCMAEGLPENGELITLEIDPKAIALARRYFTQSPHGKKIQIIEGAALDSLSHLSGPFDLVFIDADKTNYSNYYKNVLPKVRAGGLIVVDNVLWSGRVLHPTDESDHAISAFNELIKNDQRVEKVLLTLRDGLFLIRKK